MFQTKSLIILVIIILGTEVFVAIICHLLHVVIEMIFHRMIRYIKQLL